MELPVEKKVAKEGNQWVVRAESSNKILGKHKTKRDALRQLRAIESNKHGKKQLIQALSKLVRQDFDWYVAIAMGGLVPACLLGKLTGVSKIDTFCAGSYVNQERKDIAIIPKDYSHLTGKKVLVIDDLVDSGFTMQATVDLIKNIWQPKLIQTAVLYKKSDTIFEPDYFVSECLADAWITFPWEDERLLGKYVG